jgi:serine/threonine protein kinase
MSRRKVSTTIYITEEQNVELKRLHEITKVPVAEYIRQGIDIILERHRQLTSPQRQLDFESLLSPSEIEHLSSAGTSARVKVILRLSALARRARRVCKDMEQRRFGQYRVVRRLGTGGMASVYEAVHEPSGQRSAVKVLAPDVCPEQRCPQSLFQRSEGRQPGRRILGSFTSTSAGWHRAAWRTWRWSISMA